MEQTPSFLYARRAFFYLYKTELLQSTYIYHVRELVEIESQEKEGKIRVYEKDN